ncbi:MAG: SpoIIE family protein phosphatase [Nitrospina sp.]|nr:SpoIIE family protein phosphatase [Nitrospina sp.]
MKNRGIVFKLISLILVTAVIFFLIVSNHNAKKTRSIFKGNLRNSAENLSYSTLNKIETIIKAVEKIPQQMAYSLEGSSHTKENLLLLIRQTVENNPELYGATIAFEPYMFDPDALYFAPYFYKQKGETKFTYIGSESYKYFSWDWYKIPKEKNKPMWSEPYFDEGAGNIIMATYSVPFYRDIKGKKQLMGIVTADISLAWLQEMVSSIKIAETGYAFLISKEGTLITHPRQDMIMNETIFSLANKFNQPELHKLGESMVNGETNFISKKHLFTGEDAWLFYAPLPSNGWSLGVIFPQKELLAGLNKLQMELRIFAAGGLALLLLAIWFIAQSITRPLGVLSKAAEEMATGNMDTPIPEINSTDEVGRLANSFRFMEQALKKYIQQIKDISKLPGENPNPVIRAGVTGNVLYANKAATTVLEGWDIKTGNVLPVIFHELIETALNLGENQEMEVEHKNKKFTFELMPVIESGYINIYGRDITERRKAEEELSRITDEKNQIESEVKMATLVQEGFLPEATPDIPDFKFAAKTVPAKFVGGDFYDFIELEQDRLGIVLGDVSGKGVSAALYMARLMSDFRYVAMQDPQPGNVIRQVNDIAARRSRKGMFATAVFLLLDVKSKKVRVCNAGHHAMLIRRGDSEILEAGKAGGIPLGIAENVSYIEEEVQLFSGDLVFLYSDGVVEPMNDQKEHFGMTRLRSMISEPSGTPEEILEKVENAIQTFTRNAPQFDDMTFLMFKIL